MDALRWHRISVDNGSEGTEGVLHRDGSQRKSRRRFRRINPRGEREVITDGQEAPSCYNTLPADLNKMHLTDHAHQQVMHVPPSQSGCSIASDSGSSSLSDLYQATESELGDRTSDPLLGRDLVRECLEKEPADRNDDDIEQLLEFMHQLPAFANMTMSVRRDLCGVMVFEVVEQAGTVVLHDKQELDLWYVILNGTVEISHTEARVETLCMGNSFGLSPSLDKQYMGGEVRTKGDDCQFVCVAQEDYWRILNHVEKNTHKVEEEGEIVMVKEHRELDRSGTRKGHIVIKGTPDRLIMHLVEEPSVVDPTYIEDFLLTYRTFLSSPMEVGKKLLEWFMVDSLRDKVTRILLLWVNNHFNDFEGAPVMARFLEDFEKHLEDMVGFIPDRVVMIVSRVKPTLGSVAFQQKMKGHLRLLNIACAAKAKCRQVSLQKASREASLSFSLQGGSERGFGIFVDAVEPGSKAAEAGLKPGDQIMEINGQNFENISHAKATDILKNNTHLSLTVKTNIFVFKELLSRIVHEKQNGAPHIPKIQEKKGNRFSIPNLPGDLEFPSDQKSTRKMKANTVSGGRNKIRKMLEKTRFSILPPKPFSTWSCQQEVSSDGGMGQSQDDSVVGTKQCRHSVAIMPIPGSLSSSSPDLLQPASSLLDFSNPAALGLYYFGLLAAPDSYSLCEVSVSAEGVIKQRRLPDQLSKLADRIQLNGRYYLKNNMETETLCSDEDAQDLLRESQISLLQLSTVEVAAQLSMRDFELFRNIDSTEYVGDLFKLDLGAAGGHLKQFEDVINQETFWVATEILKEGNAMKRMKTIKHYVKIALHCRECKNFNSMFAIISGLNLAPVARLRASWEKLPSKYEKLFSDLQDVFDPSRNMAKYRNVLSSQSMHPPIIPLFPVVKKDLTFLHEGNDSSVDGLVNFEKLRMIAKEIRHVVRMTSANMDPALMFRQRKKRWKSLGSLSQGSTNSTMLDVQGGAHKKRVRRSSLLNAKKLYEDALMARKVKQYLANMSVETDEEKHQVQSLHCEPSYSTLSKSLSERRPTKSDMSPVSLRSALPSGKVQNRVSQVLQVQVPLYQLRRKSTAKDTGTPNAASPQVVKKPPVSTADEWSSKRPCEDTVSTVSSLHSSPTLSPQGSPRKAGGVAKSHNSQLNLSGSSSSLTGDASAKAGVASLRSYGIGYTLLPAGKADSLSDSSHSEISSRSSICSVDSMLAPGPDDGRCHGNRSCATPLGVIATTTATAPPPVVATLSAVSASSSGSSGSTATHTSGQDYGHPCTSSSSSLALRGVPLPSVVSSSVSVEELGPDRGPAADSGRGSWTSCSSNSHESFQSLPVSSCRPWDQGVHGVHPAHPALALLPPGFRHTQLAGPIAEAEAGPVASRHAGRDSESGRGRSRQSWASSGSPSDAYEGNYGTVKRRYVPGDLPGSPSPTDQEGAGQSADPAYKTVTSSTNKGLIVYCVTAPGGRDERYHAPPPTPPGYQGLALGDLGYTASPPGYQGGVPGDPGHAASPPRPPHLKPPEYSVALQRSRLLHSPVVAGGLQHHHHRHDNGSHHHRDGCRLPGGAAGLGGSRPASVCLPPPGLADSEDEGSVGLDLRTADLSPGPESWTRVLNPRPGPESWTRVLNPSPGPESGPESWTRVLDPSPGPESWTRVLDPSPGPESWTRVLDPSPGPSCYFGLLVQHTHAFCLTVLVAVVLYVF
ncbi:hypothetical protein NHX12_009850 [Muraenolepis orangiensis]|uniref:Uncharacterized protein n=1 Tax=Muraenolepis orangiensis TaxID=630683 RepID=A0A9Q0I8B3_9TELE|nr:hypothetical protein NHX12_009850 [Muraenolepis orangiensis]